MRPSRPGKPPNNFPSPTMSSALWICFSLSKLRKRARAKPDAEAAAYFSCGDYAQRAGQLAALPGIGARVSEPNRGARLRLDGWHESRRGKLRCGISFRSMDRLRLTKEQMFGLV